MVSGESSEGYIFDYQHFSPENCVPSDVEVEVIKEEDLEEVPSPEKQVRKMILQEPEKEPFAHTSSLLK